MKPNSNAHLLSNEEHDCNKGVLFTRGIPLAIGAAKGGGLKSCGFTLFEVMVVVAVVAILSAVALPAYTTYVTQSKLPDAFAGLLALGQNLETYYQDNQTYIGACQANTEAALPNDASFVFSCPTLTAQTWVAQAVGRPGTALAGFTFTLDSQGNRATVSAPSGWATQPACWTRDKAGDCGS